MPDMHKNSPGFKAYDTQSGGFKKEANKDIRSESEAIPLYGTNDEKEASSDDDDDEDEESTEVIITRDVYKDITETGNPKYKMESTVFKYTKKFRGLSSFRILQYKDAVYKGLVNDSGKRHGKGVMVYDSG